MTSRSMFGVGWEDARDGPGSAQLARSAAELRQLPVGSLKPITRGGTPQALPIRRMGVGGRGRPTATEGKR